jgi:hypothetical protein
MRVIPRIFSQHAAMIDALLVLAFAATAFAEELFWKDR